MSAAAATRRVRVRWPPTPRQSPFSSHFCGIENKAKRSDVQIRNTKREIVCKHNGKRARTHGSGAFLGRGLSGGHGRQRRHGRVRLHAALKWRTLFNVSRYKK